MNIPFEAPYGLTYDQAIKVFYYVEQYFGMHDAEMELDFLQDNKFKSLSDEEKLKVVDKIAYNYLNAMHDSGDWHQYCMDAIADWQEGRLG